MHKTINILIVEDEVLIAEDIKQTIEGVGYQNVYRSRSYNEAIEVLKLHNIDFVLLDVNLKGIYTGIDLGNYINKQYQIPFVYLTSHSDKETIAEVKLTKPQGFLLKPCTQSLLLASIEIALFTFYDNNPDKNLFEINQSQNIDFDFIVNDHLLIKEKNCFVKIPLDYILWFESDRNYIDAKTAERKYTLRNSLKKLLQQLPPNDFLKCQKQYVVNVKKITSFSPNNIFINDIQIPIGRKEQETVLASLKNRMGSTSN
jgi:DNA-binding LytR/AlgR family response regulator